MFPEINFKADIIRTSLGPRPKFVLSLSTQVRAGQLSWRPMVPSVVMLYLPSRPRLETTLAFRLGSIPVLRPLFAGSALCLTPSGVKVKFITRSSTLIVPLPGYVFDSPIPGRGERLPGIYLGGGWFMSSYPVDIRSLEVHIEGYLPCRRGPAPAPKAYLEVFNIVPELLKELWRDGLDSGPSQELGLEYNEIVCSGGTIYGPEQKEILFI